MGPLEREVIDLLIPSRDYLPVPIAQDYLPATASQLHAEIIRLDEPLRFITKVIYVA